MKKIITLTLALILTSITLAQSINIFTAALPNTLQTFTVEYAQPLTTNLSLLAGVSAAPLTTQVDAHLGLAYRVLTLDTLNFSALTRLSNPIYQYSFAPELQLAAQLTHNSGGQGMLLAEAGIRVSRDWSYVPFVNVGVNVTLP